LNRRLFVLRLPIAFLLAPVLLASAAFGQVSGDSLNLTILHTNDLHGHIVPFAYTETERSKEEKESVGGAARRATLIRRLKKEIKNPVIVVDSGDAFTRGPLTNAYEGIADIEAMNAVGYELGAIGNNEFKAKDAIEATDASGAQFSLLRFIRRSRFPWLCANAVTEKGALLDGVQPYVVREFAGNGGPVRVGFLGLTAPRSASYPQVKGWKITDPFASAKEYLPKVRAESDVVVALTHIGTLLDAKLAAETTGIEAIVGGDSHTFLYKAMEIKNADGSRIVPITQTGEFGVNLGRFDLNFKKSEGIWKLASYRYELIPVSKDIPEAGDVKAVIEPFLKPMMELVGRLPDNRIGKSPEERTRLSTLAVCDALKRQTGADFAVNPLGGGFFDVFRDRNIRRLDVYAMMPFKNVAVIANVTGALLQEISRQKDNIISGDILSVDAARTYKVALVDFIARDSYKIPDTSFISTGKDIRELFIADLPK